MMRRCVQLRYLYRQTRPFTTSIVPIPNRNDLALEVSIPDNAVPTTPTILHLPFHTEPSNILSHCDNLREHLSSYTHITPVIPSGTVYQRPFPALLFDTVDILSTLYAEFSSSASLCVFASGIAASTALAVGLSSCVPVPSDSDDPQPAVPITAVAVFEPLVDVFALGGWQNVGFHTTYFIWSELYSDESTRQRKAVFGSDPTLYWCDPFASPIEFVAMGGAQWPQVGMMERTIGHLNEVNIHYKREHKHTQDNFNMITNKQTQDNWRFEGPLRVLQNDDIIGLGWKKRHLWTGCDLSMDTTLLVDIGGLKSSMKNAAEEFVGFAGRRLGKKLLVRRGTNVGDTTPLIKAMGIAADRGVVEVDGNTEWQYG